MAFYMSNCKVGILNVRHEFLCILRENVQVFLCNALYLREWVRLRRVQGTQSTTLICLWYWVCFTVLMHWVTNCYQRNIWVEGKTQISDGIEEVAAGGRAVLESFLLELGIWSLKQRLVVHQNENVNFWWLSSPKVRKWKPILITGCW